MPREAGSKGWREKEGYMAIEEFLERDEATEDAERSRFRRVERFSADLLGRES